MADVCLVCGRRVKNGQQGIRCEGECNRWFHMSCIKMAKKPMKNFPMIHPRHGPAKERIARHCLTSKV
jgi:hypothetical protein